MAKAFASAAVRDQIRTALNRPAEGFHVASAAREQEAGGA